MSAKLKLKAALFGAVSFIVFFMGLLSTLAGLRGNEEEPARLKIPVLVYHRFGPVVADSMTVTTYHFECHMKYLMETGYTVIPLRQLVAYHVGKIKSLPPRSIALTVDDGHVSVYQHLFPLVRKYNIPVTLFLYPSAISNASYAMTWGQLREIQASGLFDFQGHTYWHPNFKNERKKLSPGDYEAFVEMQLKKSKEKLEKELAIRVDMLSWPFGIYDDDLIRKAAGSGYVAAFTIERRHTKASDPVMALPRYLITDADRGKAFEKIVRGAPCL
ncbi:MAG: polysaccharide deacetylase family protein [Thermodesulfobacteriota bacterium]